MGGVALQFVLGTAGAILVSLIVSRLSGESGTSAPFGAVFVGVSCASLSHFASPWATAVVLALYGVAGLYEVVRDRAARKA